MYVCYVCMWVCMYVIYLIAARIPPGQVEGGCWDDGLLGSLGCLVSKCSCVVWVAWVAGIATLIALQTEVQNPNGDPNQIKID